MSTYENVESSDSLLKPLITVKKLALVLMVPLSKYAANLMHMLPTAKVTLFIDLAGFISIFPDVTKGSQK